MGKWLAVLKRVATALPYLTFVTVLLYIAGREFNSNYWHGVGLPLMATDKQFADMLYDGFLGYILWTGSIFGLKTSPVLIIVIVSILGVLAYAGLEWGVDHVLIKVAARRKTSTKPPPSPRAELIQEGLEKNLLRFFHTTLVLLALPLLFSLTVLTPAVPSVAFGRKGLDVGIKEAAHYEAEIRQLRDGLVDVTVVNVKLADDDKLARVVPMECRGDRCAAMTANGPISLPKDRFGEESVVRANLTDACFTAAGLARRRIEAAISR
jgi:hypothetical protein